MSGSLNNLWNFEHLNKFGRASDEHGDSLAKDDKFWKTLVDLTFALGSLLTVAFQSGQMVTMSMLSCWQTDILFYFIYLVSLTGAHFFIICSVGAVYEQSVLCGLTHQVRIGRATT